jgi:hypothetical protein
MSTATPSPPAAASPMSRLGYSIAERNYDSNHAIGGHVLLRLKPAFAWHETSAALRSAVRQEVADIIAGVKAGFADSEPAKQLASLRTERDKAAQVEQAAYAMAQGTKNMRAADLAAGKPIDDHETTIATATADGVKYRARREDLDAMIATADSKAKALLRDRLMEAVKTLILQRHDAAQAANRAIAEAAAPLVTAAFRAEFALQETNEMEKRLAAEHGDFTFGLKEAIAAARVQL